MKAMGTIEDLIEEAKLRAIWWALCVFAVTYFFSHTSSSMWMNLPVSLLFVVALRVLFTEVEFRRKPRQQDGPRSYLSHLERKQLSVNDSRLSFVPPPPRWKRKIDSLVVELAVGDFVDKVLKDFVADLWYEEITPDKEAPELMRGVIMDVLGEISGRVKDINLVDLLTRDVVDLIGDHLDLFRRNQAAIGTDVMATLSTEQRDERLKHHLMNSKELHPALVSPESEYKILKRLISGILAVVLRPREAQCPLVRTIAREIVTCLVMQPVMDLASPGYINEMIEVILLAITDGGQLGDVSLGVVPGGESTTRNSTSISHQGNDILKEKRSKQGVYATSKIVHAETFRDDLSNHELMKPRQADWARTLEATTQRRTEILAPENLENMWAKGRNYKRKDNKNLKPPFRKSTNMGKSVVQLAPQLNQDSVLSCEKSNVAEGPKDASNISAHESKSKLKRSISTPALNEQPEKKLSCSGYGSGQLISEFYSPDFGLHRQDNAATKVTDILVRHEGSQARKLKCRVVGAYFEKLGSKSFAVYSIAVTDAECRTWFVKRRYRNFERLHRHLKDIPNYTLHLPPKRIFSSSTEDAFVHQRCIQLDKYLQDLLAIANVAEQHEVWDFLSASSKNYSFEKSPSVMRTLAVNVDDAMDDIVRQFKGVSDGLKQTAVGSYQVDETSTSTYGRDLSWHAEDVNRYSSRQEMLEAMNCNSDNSESHYHESHSLDDMGSNTQANDWLSDSELNSKRSRNHDEDAKALELHKKTNSDLKLDFLHRVASPAASAFVIPNAVEDPVGMPPEWTPSNVSVPLLNLVDKVFQLKRRGWLRRQVFWISKQILQLIMEDAIDDWLLRHIFWLRREETVALGIRWLQDILWPGGTFFTRVRDAQSKVDDSELKPTPFQISQFNGRKVSNQASFEEQLEAARRVSNIRKILFDGAPTALVSMIGNKQYKRCARDIFYFTQSTVCIKQLAYAILELLVISVFPELRDLVRELHDESSSVRSGR